jgi:small subunit ribosomal protein S20
MANHASALKAHRQNQKRRERNRENRGQLRTGLRKFNALLEEMNLEQAKTSLPALHALVDKAVRKQALSKNAGDRQKSRLTRRLNRISAAPPKA